VVIPIKSLPATGNPPLARRDAAQTHLAPGAITLASLPPLSLYVHFPWCVRKCPYCDFNSHVTNGTEPIPEARYIDALIRDLELSLPLIWGRRIHTIFFGGGTPSLLSPNGFARLMSEIRSRSGLEADAEITLEANPGTFEANKFAAYREHGVNRLSIGIQSFNDNHLRALGRIHDGREAHKAIEVAARLFDNFNLDLMYALPGQTPAQLQAELDTALSFDPPHLSYYHLTLEPNTVFAKFPPELPDDDAAAEMQLQIESRLSEAGYTHYETSAYAKPGRTSRHNTNYWRFGDYVGIGAGAHGKLSFAHRILRTAKLRQPESYMAGCEAGAPLAEEHEVGTKELPFEYMMNALRLTEGFAVREFGERTGLPLSAAEAALNEAERKGLITRDHLRIAPTERGRLFLNELLQIFL
jgi:putative oxygen-independent coproporphyrinogen III oxidase